MHGSEGVIVQASCAARVPPRRPVPTLLLGAVCMLSTDARLFVKMTGPAAAVDGAEVGLRRVLPLPEGRECNRPC
jgi:hypothetical protein